MELEMPHASVALIFGVTGMVGLSLAEARRSRRPLESLRSRPPPEPRSLPISVIDQYITFDAFSSDDTAAKLSPISNDVTHIFWVAIQVREMEELNTAVNAAMLSNVLDVFKSAQFSRLRHVTIQTGTKHYMGPIFRPEISKRLSPPETQFREDSPPLPFPNFYYALEDLVASHTPSITYSVHRSSSIVGASSRSAYNLLLTLAVYAAICKHESLPFRYPGTRYTWEHFCDISDTRLLAEQQIWAAVTEKANNEAFNCVNGDVFTWKIMWKVPCEVFEVEFVEFDESQQEFDFVGMMREKGKFWEGIVKKHGLYETKLEEITCPEALNAVLNLEFQLVCNMNKSRSFGWFEHVDSLESIDFWVERLRAMNITPEGVRNIFDLSCCSCLWFGS